MRSSIWQVFLKLAVVAAVWYLLTHRSSVPEGSLLPASRGQPVTREEVLAVARAYAEHEWLPSQENVRHARDRSGVAVETADDTKNEASPDRWRPGRMTTGIPYKWGGFDTPASFTEGLLAGKAAGDLYSFAKRRSGDESVSEEAVGVDCSGFISRCWRLPEKYGTATLPGLCRSLASTDDLQPGDVMNIPHRHVLLFARWLNGGKSRALFYEAEGDRLARVVASERNLWELRLLGAKPLRYGRIGD